MSSKKKAIIVGAGPAGLTAAYELLKQTDVIPFIYEMSDEIGGISRTVRYKGNRIDIGGHRFFSRSDRVMDWWRSFFPLMGKPAKDDLALDRKPPLSDAPNAPDPEKEDAVMLVRNRLSRIYFLRKFFDYPVSLNAATILNLGLGRLSKIGFSYVKAMIRPIRKEENLEQFFINRFGYELYKTFFKDYTEKVWGVACSEIPSEWGAQRIKGLSITRAVLHALKQMVAKDMSIDQKGIETSLIEQFMYPKYGPGQIWEEVARQVKDMGGDIYMKSEATGFRVDGERITSIKIKNSDGTTSQHEADYFFSTMPIVDLINGMEPMPPKNVRDVANGLMYRDFITVGLLLDKLNIKNESRIPTVNDIVPDNWIYIQERDVKLGRLQIFNNWSPYLVDDDSKAWIGLEYFCNEGDDLWARDDGDFARFAIGELEHIGIIDTEDVIDQVVIRQPKTYPAYFGTYNRFSELGEFVDGFENLFLIGRNGMHRYNNQDHSMLTAMTAVDNIKNGFTGKSNIWEVNTEQDYHEEK